LRGDFVAAVSSAQRRAALPGRRRVSCAAAPITSRRRDTACRPSHLACPVALSGRGSWSVLV